MAKLKFASDPKRSESLFTRLGKKISPESVFGQNFLPALVPKLLFTALLLIFYIGNRHYADKNVRALTKLKKETEDLRADYTTLKSDYMAATKQSEVAKRVEQLGLSESDEPPSRIIKGTTVQH